MTDKMREEFEKSPRFRGMDFTRSATHPEFYDSPYANGAWDGWKASREALVIEPVLGDQLPPVGSKVQIHLGRSDAWIEHIVAGYYVWGDLGGNESLSRVFVRVRDESGYLNARPLKDVRPVVASVLGETVSVPKELCHE